MYIVNRLLHVENSYKCIVSLVLSEPYLVVLLTCVIDIKLLFSGTKICLVKISMYFRGYRPLDSMDDSGLAG